MRICSQNGGCEPDGERVSLVWQGISDIAYLRGLILCNRKYPCMVGQPPDGLVLVVNAPGTEGIPCSVVREQPQTVLLYCSTGILVVGSDLHPCYLRIRDVG